LGLEQVEVKRNGVGSGFVLDLERLSDEIRHQLSLEFGACMNCSKDEEVVRLQEREGDVVCPQCGLVYAENMVEDDRIPFSEDNVQSGHSESHYSPGGQLVFGAGNGARPRDDVRVLFSVLARAPAGQKDLPLRVQHIRILISKRDHPVVESLLSFGSGFCKKHGLHSNLDEHTKFADELGRMLRRVGAYIAFRGESWGELERTGAAVFCLLFRRCYPTLYDKLRVDPNFWELGLSEELLGYYDNLIWFLTAPKWKKSSK
jgi:hypothetical protein